MQHFVQGHDHTLSYKNIKTQLFIHHTFYLMIICFFQILQTKKSIQLTRRCLVLQIRLVLNSDIASRRWTLNLLHLCCNIPSHAYSCSWWKPYWLCLGHSRRTSPSKIWKDKERNECKPFVLIMQFANKTHFQKTWPSKSGKMHKCKCMS